MIEPEKENSRDLLAKMEAEEAAAREKVDKLTQENAAKRKELLEKLRADDLADVIVKCQMHSFTFTDVKKGLKAKGAARNSTPRKSTARKTPTTRRKKSP